MTARIVVEGCYVATMDAADRQDPDGHVVLENGRIAAVGAGGAPEGPGTRIDGSGMLATPGLVNCHHHLYQFLTRGLATDENLFGWLTALYPKWALIDEDMEAAAARAGICALLISGCTTSTDHHYVFPRSTGDLLGAEVDAARELGIRFHPCRGSMDLGRSTGGLPPDEVTEDRDEVLAATEAAIDNFHDASFDSMLRIAVAPCSPFSVTTELMTEAAALARDRGVRLHTHLAETTEEDEFCRERFGVSPVEYLDSLGWLGDDVWLAHCIHLGDDDVARFGKTKTGVAHCPSSNARLGAGIARTADLVAAGSPVGLGVDGAASNESGWLAPEMRAAMHFARLRGGPAALTARAALGLATRHGARCLGREGEIGSLEVGGNGDLALWPLDDAGHAGIEDPITALVFGPPTRAAHLFVGGRRVVDEGSLLTADEDKLAVELAAACRRLRDRVEDRK